MDFEVDQTQRLDRAKAQRERAGSSTGVPESLVPRCAPAGEAVTLTLVVISEIAIVMIVIFRFLLAATGILASPSATVTRTSSPR